MPDIGQSKKLADLFDVSLDDLASHAPELPVLIPQKGKHVFGCVKVGEKGQIVIPARARKIFGIQPGDSLIVLGDESQGLALMKTDFFLTMADMVRSKMHEHE